jgi:positive regulator of sigma E activity
MTRVEVYSCAAVCLVSGVIAALLIKFLSLTEGLSMLVIVLGTAVTVLFGSEVDRRARLRQRGRTR